VLFGVAAESCQVEFDALGGPGSGDWRGCLLTPLHTNTALFAKQAASLDRISGGRLVLGLGIGGWDGGREARHGDQVQRLSRRVRGSGQSRGCCRAGQVRRRNRPGPSVGNSMSDGACRTAGKYSNRPGQGRAAMHAGDGDLREWTPVDALPVDGSKRSGIRIPISQQVRMIIRTSRVASRRPDETWLFSWRIGRAVFVMAACSPEAG
jgi:hypothetical protein